MTDKPRPHLAVVPERAPYLQPAEPLDHEAAKALREFFAAEHRRLEWSHYALRALWNDGPAEVPGERDHERKLRHAFHPRRWRIEGPSYPTRISRSWPEVHCTLYEAERLAEALELAFADGEAAKLAEVRAVLGVRGGA